MARVIAKDVAQALFGDSDDDSDDSSSSSSSVTGGPGGAGAGIEMVQDMVMQFVPTMHPACRGRPPLPRHVAWVAPKGTTVCKRVVAGLVQVAVDDGAARPVVQEVQRVASVGVGSADVVVVVATEARVDAAACFKRVSPCGGVVVLAPEAFEVRPPPRVRCQGGGWRELPMSVPTGTGVELRFAAAFQRDPIDVNVEAVEWADGSAEAIRREQLRVRAVTVPLSVAERRTSSFSAETVRRAVAIMQRYGMILLPQLQPPAVVADWGARAMADFDEVDALLRARDMNVRAPHLGTPIPNFQELGMRQPGRVDIRHTPRMSSPSPTPCGKTPRDCQALRDLLQPLCNPTDGAHHAAGNWGRWNFEGGGPAAPKPPLVAAPAGCVLSLPGSGDQLLHADTPHLYEHVELPPHYLNFFFPAAASTPKPVAAGAADAKARVGPGAAGAAATVASAVAGGAGAHAGAGAAGAVDTEARAGAGAGGGGPSAGVGAEADMEGSVDAGRTPLSVGQTAFLLETHKLERSRACMDNMDGEEAGLVERRRLLIRPHLALGDALLFDVRVLHMGLANKSKTIRRPVIYTNLYQPWWNRDKVDKNFTPEQLLTSKDKP